MVTGSRRRDDFQTVALIAIAVFGMACSGDDPSTEVVAPLTAADRARAEFEGAYPVEATPTGTVRTFDITAAPTEHALGDGRSLAVWAYNGTVPGPTLRIRLGETLRVRFSNALPHETTIHWHGVRLPNEMDGVPSLTQPAVAPGDTFVYEFTPKDAGTFWFHPHVRSSEQVERGLYGVLIVEDVEPPPYDRDLVWVLDDWRLDDAGQIDERFNTRHDLATTGAGATCGPSTAAPKRLSHFGPVNACGCDCSIPRMGGSSHPTSVDSTRASLPSTGSTCARRSTRTASSSRLAIA